jgi:hypothetical protein
LISRTGVGVRKLSQPTCLQVARFQISNSEDMPLRFAIPSGQEEGSPNSCIYLSCAIMDQDVPSEDGTRQGLGRFLANNMRRWIFFGPQIRVDP